MTLIFPLSSNSQGLHLLQYNYLALGLLHLPPILSFNRLLLTQPSHHLKPLCKLGKLRLSPPYLLWPPSLRRSRQESQRETGLSMISGALAGVSAHFAATMPSGVDLKAPGVALPVRFWYSPPIPFWPFQLSCAAYSIVPWIIAIWRFLAEAGGTPYLAVKRLTLASA